MEVIPDDRDEATNRRVALVTGGGSGVGRAVALALTAEGMAVGVLGRTLEPLRESVRLVENAGGRALPLVADAADEAAVAAAFAWLDSAFGGLDVLVCAAGVGLYGPVADYALEDWQRTLATNLTGVFLPCRAAIPRLRQRGGGAIIGIGSGAGKQGYANLAAYSASKFGLLGFMQSLAAEVGNDGIKVSTILPGSILTGFAGRAVEEKRAQLADGHKYLEPEDIAEAVRFLLRQPDRAWTQELNLWPF